MRCQIAFLLLALGTQPCLSQRGGHQFSGYVREETTNTPVQSVALEILSSGMRAAPAVVSGMDGEFRFAGLRDGDYYIVASKKGYDTATVSASILAGASPTILIYLHKQKTGQPSSQEGAVSARQLSIPEKARAAFEKGWKLLYEKSAPEKSISSFQLAIDEYASYYEAYTQIGVADYRLGRFPEAEKALGQSIEVSQGKYPDALFLLAQMLNDQERFKEAEPLARQAIAAGDSSWHGHFEAARALVGMKRSAEAEASALKAKELKPDNAQVYLVLANAHIQQQRFSEVVKDFDEYLKLEPNAPGSAQIRQRRDRIRDALRHAAEESSPAKQ